MNSRALPLSLALPTPRSARPFARVALPSALFGALFGAAGATPALGQAWELCAPLRTIPGEVNADRFGWILDDVGDVDGDGVHDVVASAPFSDAGGPNAGRVYLASGASGAILQTWTGQAADQLGYFCAGSPDLDGDGVPEIMAGAPAVAQPALPGQAFVWSGASGALLYSYVGEAPGDRFGIMLNAVGDVDGDAVSDFLVGADRHDAVGQNAGRAYLYSGANGQLIATFDGTASGERLGAGVGSAGDRNHDGRADLLIASPGAQPAPRVDVLDGASLQVVCSHDGDSGATAAYGTFFLETVGDVDADGTLDYAFGDWNDPTAANAAGKAYVYSGASCTRLYTFVGESATDNFGGGHPGVGDLDGDGHDDLGFCAWFANDVGQNSGRLVFYSGADGSELWRYTGDLAGQAFGSELHGMGDLDGDGWPDFATSSTMPAGGAGAVYLISSRPEPPRHYCGGEPNSVGAGARMGYRRSLSLTTNDFRLRVDGAVPGESGQFFFGDQTQDVPFGDGRLCVAGPLRRIGAPITLTSGGSKQIAIDFGAAPFAGVVQPGQSYYFQFWYRDPNAGGSGFNTSDGMSIRLCP